MTEIVLPARVVRYAFGALKLSMSNDEARPHMYGILMEGYRGKLNMLATDGHQMAIWEEKVSPKVPKGEWIVRADFVKWMVKLSSEICRVAKKDYTRFLNYGSPVLGREDWKGQDPIMVFDMDNKVVQHPFGETRIPITDETFPRWRQVVPKWKELEESGGQSIASSGVTAFNSGYVAKAVKAIDMAVSAHKPSGIPQPVVIYSEGPLHPAVFRCSRARHYTHVLMPIRAHDEEFGRE
jgi:DNA polymerase III sliding clamp (beta) subunit (PCNA family)